MIELLEQHRETIKALCRRHGVRRLAAFGSSVRGDFRPETSDVDFVVEFAASDPDAYADAYFGLLFGLRELLDRPVELVTARSIRNPYFREEIEQTAQTLYAA